MMKRFIVPALLCLFCTAQLGRAQTYWVIENTTDQLCRVNVNTLTATVVGNLGVNWGFGGLGFASNGTLYGWNSLSNSLFTINTTTGAASLVGSGATSIETFDINPVDGRAYAIALGAPPITVQEVNLATGSTSFVANTSPSTSITGSAFDASGRWYGTFATPSTLFTINQTTGAVTNIGATGLSITSTNLGYNFADNQLYMIQLLSANFPLFRIDPTNGNSTFVGNVSGLPGGNNQQIVAGTFQLVAVPEPTTWALAGLAVIGTIGFAYLRKRKTTLALDGKLL